MAVLQLGAQLGQQNLPMDEWRRLWRHLDAKGIDWISLWDHLYEAPMVEGGQYHFEAVASLAALATETTRARLGVLVFYVGFRNPALLAKAAMTIDHLSGGRFEIGLGAGWNDVEALAFGYDFPSTGTRIGMLEDATELIRRMTTQEITTHSGPYFQVTDAAMRPLPVKGRMPIWIGGIGEKRTMRLAAQQADGWNAAFLSPDEYRRLCGILDAHCEAIGRDPATIERSINVLFGIGIDERDAQRNVDALTKEFGATWQRASPGVLTGTPESAIERILEYHDAGATLVNMSIRAPIHYEAIDAWFEVTVPAVRRATGGGRA